MAWIGGCLGISLLLNILRASLSLLGSGACFGTLTGVELVRSGRVACGERHNFVSEDTAVEQAIEWFCI